MGKAGNNQVEIRGPQLGEAIKCMKTIDAALHTALSQGEALKSDIDGQPDWTGKNKLAFSAFMDILLQYQRQVTKIASQHAASLQSLQKDIAAFSGTDEVSKIKGL
ncbi:MULTISPECIES: hypothetical protein [unclassified Sporolactobacillus]|uniref:hypothetical protein n=1 Tax=unclassified Sporolactobacillus TaxID=2628533 RepID=UPI002368A143|nr:hypothetical protein [Sporolactobacillus sp. CQH2019]MDD9149863.1 hypothetical protein [Sporolactobacillus sp. CQH2019]